MSTYTNPTEGDSLLIWGTVGQTNGLTQFIPDSISILISGTAVVPTPELTNILDEGTESILLEMMDNYVLIDSSATGLYTMRAVNGLDTISIRVDANTDVDDSLSVLSNTLVSGDTICGLIGIGSQFDSSSPYTEDYLIIPSRYADLSICRLSVGLSESNSKESTFSIAPNPTSGTFMIRTDGFKGETIRIQIRDLSGRVVFEENVRNTKGQFQRSMDLADNAKGIYFISLSDGTEVINKKMILK